jgi:hypothetical protein
MVWREHRVVVTLDLTESDLAALAADGWTVVKPDAEAVAAALMEKE